MKEKQPGRLSRRGLIGGAVGAATSISPSGSRVTVTPREIDDLLPNPGMGWQTFHTFADCDPALQGLPSSCAYFRFYWREIEQVEGHIDFPRLDSLVEHARRASQRLALRIMCTGSGEYMDCPAWLKEKGCRGI